MTTFYYEPVVANRYFSKSVKYDEVYSHRNDLKKVVAYFDTRIKDWYIDPIDVLLESNLPKWRKRIVRWLTGRAHGGHYSFSVAAATCMLIDTLSQFIDGRPEGTPNVFKTFVRNNLPSYSIAVTPPIDGYRPPTGSATNPRHSQLNDVADVLYNGIRCGILHQAHSPLYCGIVPGNSPPRIEASGSTKYAAGATNSTVGGDCPVVVIQPEHLFREVMTFYTDYLKNLCDPDPQYNTIRDHFKAKFADSFGIDISAATT